MDLPERRRADDSNPGPWMGVAFAVAALVTVAVLAQRGIGDPGVHTALRLSARWAYLWFWPAYAGGALATLFGPVFRPLVVRARELGLAFASAQLAHAALVAWLYAFSAHPPGRGALLVFGPALVLTYLLAVLSWPTLARRVPSAVWRWIRTVGVEYIAFAFLLDFARNPLNSAPLHVVLYAPFLTLAIAGPSLRIAALIRRHLKPSLLIRA